MYILTFSKAHVRTCGTAYGKFKQDAQTQDAEGMQTISCVFMTKVDALSQQ